MLPLAYVAAVAALARDRGLALHIDGARLFNAAAALGVAPRALVAEADSASVCLSKGEGGIRIPGVVPPVARHGSSRLLSCV